ncbi:autotransporter domain-containing protein [Burkholderia sp. FERM BP-3421]|uniref:autotransporter domain-containing protein n=1 Tax=Burkholderia sp. FERM BP-3421 TaxID=1494466 RepID=UPI00235F998B|nr:autotransporter serine protease [Burkholderia sp. FERM BP-3421]WDD92028.1 autotransporter domain-containing protein [Burkholderia sp. FERM BP-3421]
MNNLAHHNISFNNSGLRAISVGVMALFAIITPAAHAQGYVDPGRLGDPGSWKTPEFKADWGLNQMNAEYAYAQGYNGGNVKAGVLDSGIYIQHPEFSSDRFHPVSTVGTYSSNGSLSDGSDDANGLSYDPKYTKDDITGAFKKGQPFNVPGTFIDEVNNTHGTHVSGTIGATRDGVGMHGVAFGSQVYVANTNGTDDNAMQGPDFLDYGYFKAAYQALASQGVRMVNNSWGQNSANPLDNDMSSVQSMTTAYRRFWDKNQAGQKTWLEAMTEAVKEHGFIQVVSAGNSGDGTSSAGIGANPDMNASIPYFRPDVEGRWLAVAASDPPPSTSPGGQTADSTIASYSNRCGAAKYWCVDAPGSRIKSTVNPNYPFDGSHKGRLYESVDGTSMSAPHASGALAVIMQRFPYMTNEQALSVLLTTAGHNGVLTQKPNEIDGWGNIDLRAAMKGPGQLTGLFEAKLDKGVSDTWSNNITDNALVQRKQEDGAEHAQWVETLKDKGWQNGLPANASADDRFIFEVGTIREYAYQHRAYEGSLTKSGDGLLTLSGANTYRGLTTVNGGELRINGSVTSGTVVNPNGLLTVNGTSADVAVNGGLASISGTSANVSITAQGTARITGKSADVTVNGGRAWLDGASGAVSVGNGGVVSGNGSLQSLSAQAGGTVAPGHSIGSLNVAHDASFAPGSTYAVEVSPNGSSDRIDVGGRARLSGGTVNAALESLPPPLSLSQMGTLLGRSFTILNAAGGIDGRFDAMPQRYLFVGTALTYGPNSVNLSVNRNATPFASVADTTNGRSVANALETVNGNNAVYRSVLLASDAAVPQAAFHQLSGEIYPAAYGMLINESRKVRDAALDRLWTVIRDAVPGASRTGAWAQVLGSWGSTGGNGNASGYKSSTGGFLAGVDGAVREDLRVGALAGYSHNSVSLDDQPASASFDSFHLGAYAGWQPGPFGLRIGAIHSWHRGGVDRAVQYGAAPESETGTLEAETTQVFGETGYRLNVGAASVVEPFARVAFVHLNNHGMTESGGAAALQVQGGNNDVTFSTLGLRGTTQLDLCAKVQLTLRGSAGWQHALGDGKPVGTLSFVAGSSPFSVSGVPVAKDAAVVNVSAGLALGKNGMLSVGYAGSLASRESDHAVTGNLNWKF